MEIKVFNSAAEASMFVADQILELVKQRPSANLGVATGRTMDAIYHKLVQRSQQENLKYNDVKCFAVDEYIGLAVDDPNSYESYLNLHLWNQLDFNKKNLFVPAVNQEDIDKAASEYEDQIKSCGGIDLQLLGVGLNGHIGLNEPGSSLDSRTRVVALTSSTRRSNKVLFRKGGVPLTAVTMGIGTILDSKYCLMVATGETKAEIIQKIVNGDINSKVPATAIKQHSNAILVLDKDSAKLI